MRAVCRSSSAGGGGQHHSASSSPQPPSSRALQTDAVQVVELLSKLSELQVKPHQTWLDEVLLRTVGPALPDLSPGQLASLLQVLGGWAYAPAEAFMAALHGAVRRQLPRLTMRHIADMAWGLAQLQHARQPMLDELLGAAEQLMADNSCVADARSSCTASASTSSTPEGEAAAAPLCCPGSLADLLWSCAKLSHSPGGPWLRRFAATSKALLPLFSPSQLAQVVWAFARLPFNPGQPWIDALLCVIESRLRDYDAKSISLTAWGLATLKVQPGARWLFAFECQAERSLSTLAAAELACVLWALSELKAKKASELRLGRLVRRQEGECVCWGLGGLAGA
jgi:hypothetical protein